MQSCGQRSIAPARRWTARGPFAAAAVVFALFVASSAPLQAWQGASIGGVVVDQQTLRPLTGACHHRRDRAWHRDGCEWPFHPPGPRGCVGEHRGQHDRLSSVHARGACGRSRSADRTRRVRDPARPDRGDRYGGRDAAPRDRQHGHAGPRERGRRDRADHEYAEPDQRSRARRRDHPGHRDGRFGFAGPHPRLEQLLAEQRAAPLRQWRARRQRAGHRSRRPGLRLRRHLAAQRLQP